MARASSREARGEHGLRFEQQLEASTALGLAPRFSYMVFGGAPTGFVSSFRRSCVPSGTMKGDDIADRPRSAANRSPPKNPRSLRQIACLNEAATGPHRAGGCGKLA